MVKTKNTPVYCWRSKQICFNAEYAEHIQRNIVILAYSVAKVYWQNKQKRGIYRRNGVKITNDR